MARPARPMDPVRRSALLDVAGEEFARRGYERTSLNALLNAAGVAKSSAYHHIGDKHALFALLVGERLALLESFVQLPDPADLTAEDFWPAIDELLDALSRAAAADDRTLEAGRLIYLADAPETPAGARLRENLAQWSEAMLLRGREVGCVDTSMPLELQRSLMVAVAVAVDRWALGQSASDASHRVSSLALRRLLAVAGTER